MAPEITTWSIGGRSLELGPTPWVMGVINLTPDSFYAGSRVEQAEIAAEAAAAMAGEGAQIVDLGAESTRPGSQPLAAEAECERLLPALAAVRRALPQMLISVDTRHAATARAALEAGADILNDVTGLSGAGMGELAARSACGLVLMHARGSFDSMHRLPPLADPATEVEAGLAAICQRAATAGIEPGRLVLDPGFGFGKNLDENYPLFHGLEAWGRRFGRPLLVGVSRKSFIGHTLGGVGPEARLAGSLAAATAAVLNGAMLVRTHDVAPTRDVVRVGFRIRQTRPAPPGP